MKNFTFLAFTAFLLLFMGAANAQQKRTSQRQVVERCGTMKALESWQAANPGAVQENLRTIDKLLKNPSSFTQGARLQAIVTIPVVFHIVMPNPSIVTDADIQAQIDRLNLDYSGSNTDSANIPAAFQAVRGHSQIRFVLAKRTPAGQFTNGIERRASSTSYDGSNNDPIKSTAQGGLDAWDATQYMNVWVGDGGGAILGYATFPGGAAPSQQGIVTDIIGTASNPCYVDPSFNMGRTLTHEVGHYFGLYHIWGDESGCGNSDFRNLPGCVITDPTLAGAANDQSIGDTPNQGDENFGCPTFVSSSCGSPNGDMFQNFMDYTNDACMTMFTNLQAARMEWVIANCRPGYLTTQGGNPPAGAFLWDAAPSASVNPGGFELVGCNVVAYSDALSCAGTIAPKFRYTNRGVNTITSLTVGYRLNNGTAVTQNVNVNIPGGASVVTSFPSIAVGIGNHNFKFFTSQPNGNADQVPANDTLVQSFRVMAPATPPVVEAFEAAPPFTNFVIDNPNGDVTWTRTTPGRSGSAGKISIDNFNTDTRGTFDDIRSSSITVSPSGSYSLTFDVAHKYFNQTGFHDTLSVYVSNNCGQTFSRLYQKWGATLAGTAGSQNSAYTTPAAADWRTETINLNGSILSTGQIVVVIRSSGRYGNFIHLDNINIASLGNRDLRMVSINSPGATSCSPNVTPSVTVANDGTEAITAFKVGYRINAGANTITTFNQSIAPGAQATVNLPAGAATGGANTITAFTADPVSLSGTGDGRTNNDTLTKAFTIANLIPPPIVEGFENAFPPTGWTIFNPNNNVTWIRATPGRNSANAAFFDNYNNPVPGQQDELRIPVMNVAGADSVIVTFDVAHKDYPGSADILSVHATTDCGNTFSTIYSKSGATLATAGSSTGNYTAPVASDWRNERIALGGAILTSGSLGFNIRNTNDYGNNIFIDNINISALFKRDLQLVSINTPGTLTCSTAVTPSVTVRNLGSETVTAFRVSYSINGGAAQTQNVTAVSLGRNAQMNVTLPAGNVAGTGSYNLTVYSWEPVTTSGTGDQNRGNDTLRKLFYVPGTTNAPLAETFTTTTFPPANWSVLNPDGGITWRHSPVGSTNVGSAYVNTYNYPTLGQRDELATPIINFGSPDSVRLQFDVAAVTYSYPGTTAIPIDTLEVLVTRDCGNTFNTVYKKWGNELQTVKDPNFPQTTEFLPSAPDQWRRETIDLTAFAGQSPLMVMFRVSNNFENNIYIDNVDFFTKNVPPSLKQQGYLVYPTAFNNSFNVRHYQTPSTLRFINVVNSVGQTVWTKQFSGNADREINVDLTGMAAGVYVVEVGYADQNRNIVQRVTKF